MGHPQICRQSAESRAEYSCALPVAAVPVPNCAVRDVQIGGDRAGALPVGRPQQCPANHHGEIKAAQEQKGGKKRMGSSAGNAFGPPHGDPPLADEAPVPRPPDHGHRARRTCRPGDLHPRSDRHVPLHIERALPYDRHAVLVHRVALQGCQSLAGSFSFGALIMSATVARRPNASAPEQPLRLFSVSGTAPEGRRTRTRTPSSIYVAVTGLLGPMESCRLQMGAWGLVFFLWMLTFWTDDLTQHLAPLAFFLMGVCLVVCRDVYIRLAKAANAAVVA